MWKLEHKGNTPEALMLWTCTLDEAQCCSYQLYIRHFRNGFIFTKLCENKSCKNGKNHSVIYRCRYITPLLRIFNMANMSLTLFAKIKFSRLKISEFTLKCLNVALSCSCFKWVSCLPVFCLGSIGWSMIREYNEELAKFIDHSSCHPE